MSESNGNSTTALNCLAILAVCGAIYFASPLLIPIVGALLLSLLFLPLIRKLKKFKIPTPVSSLIVIIFLTVVLITGLLALGDATQRWAEQAPETIERLEQKLTGAKGPLEDLSEATSKLEKIATLDEENPSTKSGGFEPSWRSGDLIGRVFSGSLNLLFGLGVCLVLTLFILAYGDSLERGLVNTSPDFKTKRQLIAAKREIEVVLGKFLTARSAINLGLALVLWPAFEILGVSNALQWAITAAALNYIPYVGAVILSVLLLASSMVTEDTFAAAILPAAVFIGVNTIEGMIVSPVVIGRWMRLNSIAVFLSVVVLGWFWGIAGAIMAVPLLISFSIICTTSERWKFLGALISGTSAAAADVDQNESPEAG